MNAKTIPVLPLVALAVLMGVTRFQHFGSSINPPDASLAVFFLLGLIASWRWFPAYALLAGAIDYFAVTWGGVSDWCITPAYVFLLPTYAAMMAGGRWARRYRELRAAQLPPLAVAIAASVATAFAISNISFYFFSGYFGTRAFGEYLAGTLNYFPSYFAVTLGYIVAALVIARLARQLRSPRPAGA